jgi:hypothetical protein
MSFRLIYLWLFDDATGNLTVQKRTRRKACSAPDTTAGPDLMVETG